MLYQADDIQIHLCCTYYSLSQVYIGYLFPRSWPYWYDSIDISAQNQGFTTSQNLNYKQVVTWFKLQRCCHKKSHYNLFVTYQPSCSYDMKLYRIVQKPVPSTWAVLMRKGSACVWQRCAGSYDGTCQLRITWRNSWLNSIMAESSVTTEYYKTQHPCGLRQGFTPIILLFYKNIYEETIS